jgi:osmotically-inducible protein OsmY
MKIPIKKLLLIAISLGSIATYGAYPTNSNLTTTTPANQQGVTADSQMKALDSQTEMTRRLRAKLMADDQLSTEAHNIKIITLQNGITLKGPVATRAEKVKIENYARSMAGEMKVFNQLTYKR